jgi:hypothetical protein
LFSSRLSNDKASGAFAPELTSRLNQARRDAAGGLLGALRRTLPIGTVTT